MTPPREVILIVDDNEMNRDMLARRLSRKGYETVTADDGSRVMELLREQAIDLILLDIMMPGINGLDVLRQIRAVYSPAEVPVIMVTVKDQSADIVEALELGANDYVTKPVDFPVALARVRTQLLLKRSQEELQRGAAQLERSNRELKAFVSAVSHDLQQPLWKIVASGQRLKERTGNDLAGEDAELLERMLQAAKWMQIMFDGLLSYALVTTKTHRFVPVSLARVLQQVLADLELRVEQTGGRVEVDELPTIDADLLQMHQLLLNLVGNALKFHRPGVPPQVRVQGRIVRSGDARGGDVCELVVTDNGIGFEPRQAQRIFNMFERLHDRDEYEGTGVGLAICRKIVEHHGGTIVAESKPGEGTRFVIMLPARQPAEEHAESV